VPRSRSGGGAQNVLVGDLWGLAGQSNREGCGKRVDMEESLPLVHSLQSCEEWALAEEPLSLSELAPPSYSGTQ